MKAFEGARAALEGLGAQVLGVSPDDIPTHQRFAAFLGLGFALLTDSTKTVAKAHDATAFGGAFFDRKTFVICKAGVIRYVYRGQPSMDDLQDVLRRIGGSGGGPQGSRGEEKRGQD